MWKKSKHWHLFTRGMKHTGMSWKPTNFLFGCRWYYVSSVE